jgi:transposase InsO family protein
MSQIYQMLGISRQGHYQQRQRWLQRADEQSPFLEQVRQLRQEHPLMGARKMFYYLRPSGIGVNRFENMVIAAGFGLQRPVSAIRTTHRSRCGVIVENLTHGLELSGINQLWVTDISYVITHWGVYYLVHMLDVYSRRLLALRLSPTMKASENLQVLHQSYQSRQQWQFPELIHHSDAGSQYTSESYCQVLETSGIRRSLAENCLENGYSERINGILKQEYLAPYLQEHRGNQADPAPVASLQQYVQRVHWLYNTQRPHQELGYRTPVDFENWLTTLKPSDRPLLRLFDFRAPVTESRSLTTQPLVDSGHF